MSRPRWRPRRGWRSFPWVTVTVLGCSNLFLLWANDPFLWANDSIEPIPTFEQAVRPFVEQYCIDCHGEDEPDGGISLELYRTSREIMADGASRKIWRQAARQIRGSMMPPEEISEPRIDVDPDQVRGGHKIGDGQRMLATNGNVSVQITFPADGRYLFRVRACAQQAGDELAKMEFFVGAQRLNIVEVVAEPRQPQWYGVQVDLKAGRERVGVAFINDYYHASHADPRQRDRNLIIAGGQVIGPILAPLEPVKHDVNVLTGLTHDKARANGDGAGDHARSSAAFLTGAQPVKTAGKEIHVGVSVDQIAAREIGHGTRLPSLELGCEPGPRAGRCDSGYSCAYVNSISWRTPMTPVVKEINPRAVFDRLFGTGDAGARAETRARRERTRKSILYLSLLDRMGIPVDEAGDSTGRLGRLLET